MPRPGVKIVILSARNKLATQSRERRRAIRLAVRDQPGASIPLACLCDADKPSVSLPFIISSRPTHVGPASEFVLDTYLSIVLVTLHSQILPVHLSAAGTRRLSVSNLQRG